MLTTQSLTQDTLLIIIKKTSTRVLFDPRAITNNAAYLDEKEAKKNWFDR